MMKYYVNCNGGSDGCGTLEKPFLHIQQAAELAMPGDEVIVAPGIYRENVSPKHPGTPEKPIVYRSEVPLEAVITGAEKIEFWEKAGENVWKTRVSNAIFPERNPYTTFVSGDWFDASFPAHLGDVYRNGKSLYEVNSLEQVYHPQKNRASWDPEFSVCTWFCRQTAQNETEFYVNIGGLDPNCENMEIAVRPACFYPREEGIGYITLSGFTVCQAATQWAPPTAYQEGMIGPHWSKGWIIEDCEVFESKCSGISLGKYLQPENDNKWLKTKYKDGTQTERDCICQAQNEGWNKEHIGSHIVRRCHIHDCGQTGIVGHLGGVFSVIEDNHIHHINNKQNLAGAEIGGIKMHAAIDVIFRHNHIHHCTRGIWLDWQAQGTRVTGNLFHHNTLPNLTAENHAGDPEMQGMGEDVFIEVSHGPTLLDNNFFLSPRAVKIATQGVAMVHNLVAGSLVAIGLGTNNGSKTLVSPRYTPYHVPHSTAIAGFMTFLHGDDRFYNNIFLQQPVMPALREAEAGCRQHFNEWDDCCVSVGTMGFAGFPTQAEWEKMFEGYCGMGSPASDRYYSRLPVWTGGNVFANGAQPWEKEENFRILPDAALTLTESDGKWSLETTLFDDLPDDLCSRICTTDLGLAFEPEQPFENPDGSEIVFDRDYFGICRTDAVRPGPVQGKNRRVITF